MSALELTEKQFKGLSPEGQSDALDEMRFLKLSPEEQSLELEQMSVGGQAEAPEDGGSFLGEIGKAALEGAVEVGGAIDSVTGAPIRSAVGAMQEGGGIGDALSAFGGQFGGDSTLAPTGRDLIEGSALGDILPDASISDALPSLFSETGEGLALERGGALDISAKGAAGFGTDVLLDPTNLLPFGAIAKGVGKAAGAAGDVAKTAGAFITPGVVKTAAKGTAAAGKGAAKGTREAASSFVQSLRPVIREKFIKKQAQIATDLGFQVDELPAAVKYGENAQITKQELAGAQMPGGEPLLAKHAMGLAKVRNAVDDEIVNVGRGITPKSALETGEAIQTGYNKAVDTFFKGREGTWNEVADKGLELSQNQTSVLNKSLTGIEKGIADELSGVGVTQGLRSQGMALIEDLGVISSVVNSGDVAQIINTMRQVGNVAFKATRRVGLADIPPNKKAYQKIYFALRDSLLTNTKGKLGSNLQKKIIKNNAEVTEFLKRNSLIVDSLTDTAKGGEKIFQEFLGGNSVKMRALKDVIGEASPETIAQMKSSFLDSLMTVNKDGDLIFTQVSKNMKNNRSVKVVMETLFEPGELKRLDDLMEFGVDFGPPILNASRTGEFLANVNIGKGTFRQAANAGTRGFMEEFQRMPPSVQAVLKEDKTLWDHIFKMGSLATSLFGDVASKTNRIPNKIDLTVRAVRLMSIRQKESGVSDGKTTKIPVDMIPMLEQLIRGSELMGSVEKAKNLTRLKTRGEVYSVDGLLKEPRRPTGITRALAGQPRPTTNIQPTTGQVRKNIEPGKKENLF